VTSHQVSIQNAVSSPNDVTFSRPRPLMNVFHIMENVNFYPNASSMVIVVYYFFSIVHHSSVYVFKITYDILYYIVM